MAIEWNKENARVFVDGCKEQLSLFEQSMEAIITHKLWEKLDYESFEAMFIGEGFDQFKLSAPVRQRALETLKAGNPEISNRQAAKVLGADEKTIRNDRVRNIPHPLKDDKSESIPTKSHAEAVALRLEQDWKRFDQTLTDAVRANISWKQIAVILGISEKEALRRYN